MRVSWLAFVFGLHQSLLCKDQHGCILAFTLRGVTCFSSLGHGTIFLTFAYGLINQYHFINKSKSWSEAQQYCREHFTDLATIQRVEDLSRVHIPAAQVAWIGLHDDPAAWFKVMTNASNSWRWSVTGATSPGGYQNWWRGSPDKWRGVKKFILVNDFSRTWPACKTMCRQNYQDLAQIENAADNQAAMTALSGVQNAWIGLYRDMWLWSDLSNTVMPRSAARITLKLQSSADLTDPKIQKLFLKALEEKLGMNVTIKGIQKAERKQP
uniref:C-type lectin domain-containing protein n=1 Tax=Knipowitschia caucasica TaxID=637954 RepID=A0AAV2LXF2_KNICA